MNELEIPKDFATTERRRFIDSISPFHRHESFTPYVMAWVLALLIGKPMPHETRARRG